MLTKLHIRNLKRLREAEIPLTESVVLAGPNNFGKTTALQALSIWHLATRRWIEARETTHSRARERTGVPIARKDFTAVPVRSLDLLWTGRAVGRRKDEQKPPLVQIIVDGRDAGQAWTWGVELQYQSSELLYARAMTRGPVPDPVRASTVVHVPPLGGVLTDEEKREPGIQERLIGEGRPGDVLRNLLLQIANEQESWNALVAEMRKMFLVELQKPVFSGTYITCEYAQARAATSRKQKLLDIANAGSGFHQVLLLLAFFYARPGSVLLLDEPDAHLHIILQKDVYALVRRVASERRSQLLISTHSEVILDETDPAGIIAFTGEKPHALVNTSQKAQLKQAVTKLRSLDFLLADQVRAVLYVEGDTDANILREWARVLEHPAYAFLDKPFVHPVGGNDQSEILDHFFALRDAYPDLRGACVLDRAEASAALARWQATRPFFWKRREIENYLLHPEALARFVGKHAALGDLARTTVADWFARQVPRGFDPFDDEIIFLRDVKASDEFLLPLMETCGLSTSKKDLFLVAASMRPEEIHPEVRFALDAVATLVRQVQDAETPVGGEPEEDSEPADASP